MNFNDFFEHEMQQDYYKKLNDFIEQEYNQYTIYPKKENIFRCFEFVGYEDIKVVILGQDPYHEENQAQGLAFSVPRDIKIPPSLVNIYKELKNDLNIDSPNHGDLTYWASQGVLLLNTVLTVRAHEANSHKNKGWEILTNHVIEYLNKREKPIVFILWGKQAIDKEKMIDTSRHYVIKSVHPSPLSAYRGFFGSRPFSQTNDFLESHGMKGIDWRVE